MIKTATAAAPRDEGDGELSELLRPALLFNILNASSAGLTNRKERVESGRIGRQKFEKHERRAAEHLRAYNAGQELIGPLLASIRSVARLTDGSVNRLVARWASLRFGVGEAFLAKWLERHVAPEDLAS